jgi:hypothetical protein
MKKASLAIIAIGTLTLAACGGQNEDQLNQADINVESTGDLDELSDEAANVASEAQALENQAAEIERQAQQAQQSQQGAAEEDTKYDENIQGM